MIDENIFQLFPNNDILKVINLNDLDQKPQKDIYNSLISLKRSEFKDNERIIFYCNKPLYHQYDDLPADVLANLQKMLVYIDIPNFFCVVVSKLDLSTELTSVATTFAVGEEAIKNIVI